MFTCQEKHLDLESCDARLIFTLSHFAFNIGTILSWREKLTDRLLASFNYAFLIFSLFLCCILGFHFVMTYTAKAKK